MDSIYWREKILCMAPNQTEKLLRLSHGPLSSEKQPWLPYQILGDKTVKNVQIDPQQKIYGRKS